MKSRKKYKVFKTNLPRNKQIVLKYFQNSLINLFPFFFNL